jgi:hypothetical protein
MMVSMVPPQMIDTCWGEIKEFLERAAKYTYGRYTADDMKEMIEEGDHQLWVAFEGKKFYAAVVTNITNYPKKRFLSLAFCGGKELKLWKDPMLALLRRFARDMGCEAIEATARTGWERVFKHDGFEKHWVTFELPV